MRVKLEVVNRHLLTQQRYVTKRIIEIENCLPIGIIGLRTTLLTERDSSDQH